MADKQLTVTAALVVTKDRAGVDRYLYAGAPVPADIPADQVKRLRALGMVGEGATVVGPADPGDTAKYPEGDPAKSWTLAQLKAYALDRGIDLGEATLKDDVLLRVTGTVPEPTEGGTPPADDE